MATFMCLDCYLSTDCSDAPIVSFKQAIDTWVVRRIFTYLKLSFHIAPPKIQIFAKEKKSMI